MTSADFHDTAGAFCPHGRFALKGVTEPEEVFAPAAPDDGPGDS